MMINWIEPWQKLESYSFNTYVKMQKQNFIGVIPRLFIPPPEGNLKFCLSN